MNTDPPRAGPPRAPLSPDGSGPEVINGSGRTKIILELGRGAQRAAAAGPLAALPATAENALPRYALAVLGLAIAMFALSFLQVWKGAEFAAAALFGLTMILLLLTVVADASKSPL